MSPISHVRSDTVDSVDGNASTSSSTSSPLIRKLKNLPGVSALRARKSNPALQHFPSASNAEEISPGHQVHRRPSFRNRKRGGSISCPNVIQPDAGDMNELHDLVGQNNPKNTNGSNPTTVNSSPTGSSTSSKRGARLSPKKSLVGLSTHGKDGQVSTLGLLLPSDFSSDNAKGMKKSASSTALGTSQLVPSSDSEPSFLNATSPSSTTDSGAATTTTDTDPSSRSRSSTMFSTRRASAWDSNLTPHILAQLESRGDENDPEHLDSTVGQGVIPHEALLNAAARHFSVRGGLEEWDARFGLGSSQEKKNEQDEFDQRFSARPLSGWDASLKTLDLDKLSEEDRRELSVRLSTQGIDPKDIRFSTRPMSAWDAGIIFQDEKGHLRFSVRPESGWDAAIFKQQAENGTEISLPAEMLARFSIRPPGDWDAKVVPPCNSKAEGEDEEEEEDSNRLRSNTIFSNRPLSAWDANLTQSIPVIVRPTSTDDDDEDEDKAIRKSVALCPVDPSTLNLPDTDKNDKRHQIFSVRGDLAEWDAGLASQLRKDLNCSTPTQEEPNKGLHIGLPPPSPFCWLLTPPVPTSTQEETDLESSLHKLRLESSLLRSSHLADKIRHVQLCRRSLAMLELIRCSGLMAKRCLSTDDQRRLRTLARDLRRCLDEDEKDTGLL